MIAGNLDGTSAVLTYEPIILEAEGYPDSNFIFYSDYGAPDAPFFNIVANPEWLADNGDVATAFINGYRNAVAWTNENTERPHGSSSSSSPTRIPRSPRRSGLHTRRSAATASRHPSSGRPFLTSCSRRRCDAPSQSTSPPSSPTTTSVPSTGSSFAVGAVRPPRSGSDRSAGRTSHHARADRGTPSCAPYGPHSADLALVVNVLRRSCGHSTASWWSSIAADGYALARLVGRRGEAVGDDGHERYESRPTPSTPSSSPALVDLGLVGDPAVP